MKHFYFKSFFLSLLMVVFGNVGALADDIWVKTSLADIETGDIVMIVDQTSDRAMSNDKGTGNPPEALRVYYTDSDKTVSTGITGGTVPASLQWEVTVDNGSYKFSVSGTLNYLYCTNTNNGVRVGTNKNNSFKFVKDETSVQNSLDYYLMNEATSRFVGVYNSLDWRCYSSVNSNIKNTKTAFYKKVTSTTPALIAINETNFPDDVFRAWVAENCDKADDNGDKDGYLDEAEIAAQEVIEINGMDIEDLKGIEYFTEATLLLCGQNKLTSLDVSKNTKLTQLSCDGNQLTSLDVSGNGNLHILDCSNNQINETEMGKLVESMPTASGDGVFVFYPFNLTVEDANVITTTQVDEAKGKNWIVMAWNGEGIGYVDYDGVEPAPDTNEYYVKVTTAPSDWSGEYLIVYEEGSVAFNGGLSTLDAAHNTIAVVMDNNKIVATDAVNAATFTIAKMESADIYSIKAASGKYIGVTSYSNGLTSSETAIGNSLALDADKNAVITVTTSGGVMTLRYNSASDQARFRYFKSGQKAIQLYKKTVALDNQYTLVTVEDEGETETAFDGYTLTKELPASTKFYIKDNTGKVYYATENTEDAIISAENHENLPTYESGNNFLLKKANTWVFTITELETTEGITLTVNPETAGVTKYMVSQLLTEETEDVFDENLQLTKEMDTTPFYIIRSDDYGIFEISAAERTNTEGYARFTFTEDDKTVEFEAGKRLNMYEMSEEGTYTFTIDLTNNTVTAEKTVFDLYALVTSVTELSEGDKVIILHKDEETSMAMSTTQNTNNRGAADVTFDEDGKAKVPAATDIQVFTLEGNAEGWYFNTGDGYIYAASNSSNHLKTQETKNDNAKAVITIGEDDETSVTFQREGGRNILQYNPNSGNPLFSCYASASQYAVQIYRLVNEKDVTVKISSVGYATLYYSDRALRVPAGVTAKTYKATNGKLEESKVYETGSVIPAGQAVVLKGAEGDYPFYYTEVTGESDPESMLKGSDEAETTTGGNFYYALQAKSKDGKHGPGFYWMNSTGAAFDNGAHKAYMALPEKFGEAQGMAKEFYLFDEATTGISGLGAETDDHTEMYNLNGQRVDRGYKGVVIKNGKKFLKK